MQNARSDRVCLDFSLLRFFVSRQRNEEERQMKWNEKKSHQRQAEIVVLTFGVWMFVVCGFAARILDL